MAIVKKKEEPKSNLPAVQREPEQWEKELRDRAKAERAQETLGVPRLTHKGGILKINDNRVEGNRLAVVPLGFIYTKEWQEHEYTPGAKDTPACYAFGKAGDKGLVVHPASPKVQFTAEQGGCDKCPNNRFGTALKGGGKRCQDRRHILFLLAADLEKMGDKPTPEAINKAAHYRTSVPPGSLKNWGPYLKSLEQLTTHGSITEAITEISTEANESGAYTLTFSFLGEVPQAAMPFLVKRGEQTWDLLAQPFPVIESDAPEGKGKPEVVKGQQRAAAGKRR